MSAFLLSQILGLIALILICYSYFTTKKSNLLILQVIANIFYAVAFLIVEAYAGGIIILISTIRCVEIYFLEKRNLSGSNFSIYIYSFAYAVATIVLWQSCLDIIPLIASIIFTIAFAVTNLQKFRYLMLFPNFIFIIYSLANHTFASACLDLLELVILIFAIIKYNKYILREGQVNGDFPSP